MFLNSQKPSNREYFFTENAHRRPPVSFRVGPRAWILSLKSENKAFLLITGVIASESHTNRRYRDWGRSKTALFVDSMLSPVDSSKESTKTLSHLVRITGSWKAEGPQQGHPLDIRSQGLPINKPQ